MEDLTAAGRAADKTIQRSAAPVQVRAATVAEALQPAPELRGDPLPEHADRPAFRLGEWNDLR